MEKEVMNRFREAAKHCLRQEAACVMNLLPSIDEQFDCAVDLILKCTGKVVFTGVGKSGHIGAKIAATLSSTGTPAFFANPLDIYHGDLGVITHDDVVVAISNSGTTDELLRFVPYLVQEKVPLIGMTSNPHSLLAQYSTCCLNLRVTEEACPLKIAPTSSTTATLAMGDALASALIICREFQSRDFARFHPGGSLGRALLTRASEVMHTENLPVISRDWSMNETLLCASEGRLGLCVILDEEQRVEGIITDGDIRRALVSKKEKFVNTLVYEVMTPNPKCISGDMKIAQVPQMLKENKIHAVLVVDDDHHLLGVVDNFSCMI